MRNILLLLLIVFISVLNSCQSDYNKVVQLFNEQDLENWKPSCDASGFKVADGYLVCSGSTGKLTYIAKKPFRNFELEAEIKTSPNSCAAIWFHTTEIQSDNEAGYQVLINNSCHELDGKRFLLKTGSLAGIRNVYFPMVTDDTWFKLSVKVVENHIETFINDIKVMDYIQPDNPWRNELYINQLTGVGTFALKAIAGETAIKSINVKMLPDGVKSNLLVDETWDATVTKLMTDGFPLIDFHVHLKGGLTIEQAIENSQKLGINYGLAPNCGLRFPVTDDISLAAYMDTVRGRQIFRGMQAEGREWVTLFSPEAVAKFDYVFTDALTFTDVRGRRTRMWIPEEVWVENKQQFMEQLVGKIEAIFAKEPVDIYVNPTLLPASLMPEYDQLWTPQRMQRVIKVLKDNNIALEINSRYKVPSATMIKIAREAGLKFSFGTNNAASHLGQLEYCLQMIDACGLTPDDMFVPKPHNLKPVLVKGLPPKITG